MRGCSGKGHVDRSVPSVPRIKATVVGRGRKQPHSFCSFRGGVSGRHNPGAQHAEDSAQVQSGTELPTQGDAAVAGIDPIDYINRQLQEILKPPSTEDYLAVSGY